MTRRRRPTVDQVISELERLEAHARELRDAPAFTVRHSMRLWVDGAAHALAWALAYQVPSSPAHLDRPPSVALDLAALALPPGKRRRR